MARILIPGPAKRKVVAGPSPPPFLYMPVNRGRMVQLHTARTIPEIEATG